MKRTNPRQLPEARLCQVIQGVEFWVRAGPDSEASGDVVRAVIAVEALKEHFGAGDAPEAWLAAFENHRATIEQQACDLYAKTGRPAFIVIFEPALQGAG